MRENVHFPAGVKIETMLVTPIEAMNLLERNTLNRPLNDQHVQRIARQITGGLWVPNGDTIKISDDNGVLDGQHRLWAIIEAKMPVETCIVFGVARDAFATIDTIRKPRSKGDTLALCGVARHRNIIGSALCWLLRYQRGVLEAYRAPLNRIENSDIETAIAAHPHMAKAVEHAMKTRRVASPAVMAFVFYVASNQNPDLAERMMAVLENPARTKINDPFFQLRSHFTSDAEKKFDPVVSIALAFKALNAAANGRDISLLKWVNQGKNAETFPVLAIDKRVARKAA